MRPYGATQAGTQAPPLPRSVIFFHAIPHKQNNHLHAIHTNETNPPTHHPHKRNRRGGACVPARTSAQRRFHAKNTRIVRGDFNDGCALMGRHGRAHRLRPYPSLPNPTWCAPYPIGVILSIAQGWQVQRSLPWVTMQVRRLPPWGLYFFSSHIIITQCRINNFPIRKLILKSTMPMA